MIKPGTGTIPRRHSKNYTSAQADARLKEVVTAYQEQGKRALEVDSFAVKYFYQAKGTMVCTCKQTEILPQHGSISQHFPPTLVKQDSIGEGDIRIDYNRPLFGSTTESLDADDETESDEFGLDDSDVVQGITVDSLFASSPDCGICYRTGYVPGYNLYGYERRVLTTHHLRDTYGYTLDVTTAPHTFNKTDLREGFVEFALEIPRYFKSVTVSVRNNTEQLFDVLYTEIGELSPLSHGALQHYAGKVLAVRVTAEEFTHVVIEFDLGAETLRSNIAQMSKTIDWTLFSTLGNLQIVLPMTIPEVQAGDVVFVPQRNLTLKITDVTYLRTSDERNLDWAVTTRVLQPQESLKLIHRGNKLG